MKALVAPLTIALLVALFAGCLGNDGEASMKDLYGEAKARADEWSRDAVLVEAGAMESAEVEKWMDEDDEDDGEGSEAHDEHADDSGSSASAEMEDSDDGMPFKLRNDPDPGNGKATFWGFTFVDSKTGGALAVAVETEGEKAYVLHEEPGDDDYADAAGDWAESLGFEWSLDSDTAASKAHANDEFHSASRSLVDPVYMVGLDQGDWDSEGDEEAEEDDENATESEHGVWYVVAFGAVKGDDGETSGDWSSAVAVIDAVTGRVIESGSYEDDVYYDDFDWGYGYDTEQEVELGASEMFTQSGYVTQFEPQEALTVPAESDGVTMVIELCWGSNVRTGSATYELVGPDGEVLREAKSGGSLGPGSVEETFDELPAGDYTVTVSLAGGVATDYVLQVWVGDPDAIELERGGVSGPFFGSTC